MVPTRIHAAGRSLRQQAPINHRRGTTAVLVVKAGKDCCYHDGGTLWAVQVVSQTDFAKPLPVSGTVPAAAQLAWPLGPDGAQAATAESVLTCRRVTTVK